LNVGFSDKCPAFKYGNPSDYFNNVKITADKGVSTRENDFMPNWDQDHYWSGYYTTNPELKKVCKDYSRLVNIFRKIYTRYLLNGGVESVVVRQLLIQGDELLAVMQHHDGITATSKYHIENMFKDRMNAKSNEILNSIA
jgi:hypothetical protein